MPPSSNPLSPSLPPEIEYQIFFLAAIRDSGISVMFPFNLLTVSRRTYQWVEPLQFRTLYLTGVSLTNRQFRALLESKSPDYLARNVKHLFYDQCFKARELFDLCTGITNLVLLADIDEVTVLPNLSQYPKLKYLVLEDFMSGKFTSAMIHNPGYIPRTLTHIYWALPGDFSPLWILPNADRVKRLLPSLEYFKIEWNGDHEFIWDDLPALASLEQMVLVAIVDLTSHRSQPAPKPPKMVETLKHPKVVSLKEEQDHWFLDLRKVWRGEDHFWLQAGDCSRQRKQLLVPNRIGSSRDLIKSVT
ncbi:hypothetical protein DL96DRAFT_651889 [Flagelloscypha sp. PMI_526]|nr:hypothetical protein DL96DRAFT_651889 [Flagelloscypha sp. PMI_526]